jgi:hypothetical protein
MAHLDGFLDALALVEALLVPLRADGCPQATVALGASVGALRDAMWRCVRQAHLGVAAEKLAGPAQAALERDAAMHRKMPPSGAMAVVVLCTRAVAPYAERSCAALVRLVWLRSELAPAAAEQ